MKEKLKNMLSEERWRHSVNSSKIAYELALKHGVNPKKAEIAGLLHDCAKDMEFEKLKKMVLKYNIKTNFDIDKIPKLLHSFVGEFVAREEFNIQDLEILQAIRMHSTGGYRMTVLDKIVYLSDKIEPLRKYEGVTKIRKMADKDINQAMLLVLNEGLISLIERGLMINPATIEARNDILNKVVFQNA